MINIVLLKSIMWKYSKYFLEILKFESNVRILYRCRTINDNKTEATICRVTDWNIKDVCSYEGNKYLKKYNRFLAQGDIGYYAYLDGNWVHRTWIIIGPKAIRRWVCFPAIRIGAREAYCHFGETAPIARGYNIAAAVLKRAAVDLEEKVDCFYTFVDEKNYASRKVNEKAGFWEYKRLKRISLLGFDFYKRL